MALVDVRPAKPVEVLVDGIRHPGQLEAWQSPNGHWRGYVQRTISVGMRRLGWVDQDRLRPAGGWSARPAAWSGKRSRPRRGMSDETALLVERQWTSRKSPGRCNDVFEPSVTKATYSSCMTIRRIFCIVCLVALVCASAPAAQARGVTIDDAAGDTIDPGLDFTSVHFSNRDRAVVVHFRFVRDRRGEVIFPIRVRGRGAVALVVSQHPRVGKDHLIFQTRRSDDASCQGLRSTSGIGLTLTDDQAPLSMRAPRKLRGSQDVGSHRRLPQPEQRRGLRATDS